MISQIYIDKAKKIREDFLRISSTLTVEQTKLNSIYSNFMTYKTDLESIKNNITKESNPEKIQRDIFEKLTKLEIEGNNLSKIISPLNDQIEKLREQEEAVYQAIKSQYPELTDNDIIKELSEHIKK
jgi:Ran GTPase-activating protein (RanGAP) involved in mRNA processing and transport